MSGRLFIFTGSFPYGYRESFLEQEINYLSKEFDQIIVFPFGGNGTKKRNLPVGVSVDESLLGSKTKKIILGAINSWRVLPFFFSLKVLSDGKLLKKWLKSTLIVSYYLQSKGVKCLMKSLTPDDIIYYYWGVDFNLIAPFVKGKCIQISRFHGDWDLWYEGGKYEAYSPCRKQIMESINCAVTISEKGNSFLRARYPYLNIKTFRLGSIDWGESQKSRDGYLRILSCSAVYPLKRVDYIFQCIKEYAQTRHKVIWTHIGDGPSFDEIRRVCVSDKLIDFQVNLMGRLSHDKVMDYYKNNSVDIFINLSTNEGIPVSIMEAISFNVPIVATNVGATNEIVTEETGVLVNSNPSVDAVATALQYIEGASLTPRYFWKNNYNAEQNYSNFARYIKTLINE